MTRIDSSTESDHQLVQALRCGDEQAFAGLLDRYGPLMLRVARTHVANHEAAEDVVQDTWLAVLDGIDRFEERSSLRTWIFRILANIAKTRGVRDRRTRATDSAVEAVDGRRFRSENDEWPRHWLHPPQRWSDSPEHRLLSGEMIAVTERAIQGLPEMQGTVVWLRDVAGYDSDEVCLLLAITAGNQRVLLHRGRSVMRQALEDYR
jgi:RNA polymerase sigma-70 factor (ECF subfamily)